MTTSISLPNISTTHKNARGAVEYGIRVLSAELDKPRFVIPKGESKLYLELRRDLPYAIHETDVQGTQILVNRNYKPLGDNSRTGENWVVYEGVTNGHVRLSSAQIARLVSPGHSRSLFGDENPPWRGRREAAQYLVRLKALYSLL